MDLAVVVVRHPGLRRLVQGTEREIWPVIEHRHQPALDGAPERFLLAILVGRIGQRCLMQDPEPRQTLADLGRDHGTSIIRAPRVRENAHPDRRPAELIDLTLQALDLSQQLTLRNLGPALDLMSKLSEARFEAVGFLELTNALCELAKTCIQVGNPVELIDLTLQALDLSQQLALWNLGPALSLMSKLSEALLKVAGRLESDNALFEVCDCLADRSAMFCKHLANRLSQSATFWRIPLLDP